MKTESKLQLLHLVGLLGFVCSFFVWDTWLFLLSCGLYLLFQTFIVGISIHRHISHRAFKTGKWRRKFLIYISPFAVVGSPISWAAVHRYHHDNSDTENDPHSPYYVPLWEIITNRYWLNLHIPKKYYVDMLKDPDLRFVHKHYFKFIYAYMLFTCLFGVSGFIYLFCVPIFLVDFITNFGVIVHHIEGYRNYETDDMSRNSWILSLLTVGDGWHNNHHRSPSRYSHKIKPWEFDLQGSIIRLFFRKQYD